MSFREERKGENESLFREVNERLEQRALSKGVEERFWIVCECAEQDCAQKLSVSYTDYELVRANPRQFIVAHGHADAEVEAIVGSNDAYEVVQKFGDAGAAAEADDTRSDR